MHFKTDLDKTATLQKILAGDYKRVGRAGVNPFTGTGDKGFEAE